jgi:hypothetical protein
MYFRRQISLFLLGLNFSGQKFVREANASGILEEIFKKSIKTLEEFGIQQ